LHILSAASAIPGCRAPQEADVQVLLLGLALLAGAAAAQEPGKGDELLLSGEIEHGGFGGPEMRVSSVLGSGAVFVGGRGGWIIDHRLIIGGAGYGLASSVHAPSAVQPAAGYYDLQFGYGGLFLEWVVAPRRVWHFSVSSLFGAGGLKYASHDLAPPSTYQTSAVFVWEPALLLELNVVSFMRLDLGASYRLVQGTELAGLGNSDVGGPSGVVALKFGSF
jgi:hypothetical protein